MVPISRRLLIPALTLIVVASAAAGGLGATRAVTAQTPPRVAGEHAFPRTYHIYNSDKGFAGLVRYDMVVGFAYWDVRALRKRNPGGIYLLVPGLQPRNPRDYKGLAVTYGAVDLWKGGRDRLPGGRNVGYIRAFDPAWDQLYNADGSLAEASTAWRHEGWNLADPRRKGTPMLVAKVMAHASKRSGLYAKGWDGIHSDNWIYRIGADWFYGSNLDTNRDGRVDDYDVLRRNWARGLTRVGLLLRSYLPGKIVSGNGNWHVRSGFSQYLVKPDDHLRSADSTLLEDLQLFVGREDEIIGSVREWLGYKDQRGQPRRFAIMHKLSGENDFQAMRWGVSLATIAGAYYEAYAGSHADTFWYDEYDGGAGVRKRRWLGQPITAPTKLPNGVWRRDYENGMVLNNSTSSPQAVTLGAAYRRLAGPQDPSVNDGTSVTEVTIAPRDGLFLRRIAAS